MNSIKKIIFGGFFMLSGFFGIGVICATHLTRTSRINLKHNLWDTIRLYELQLFFNVFLLLAIVGVIISVFGLLEKSE